MYRPVHLRWYSLSFGYDQSGLMFLKIILSTQALDLLSIESIPFRERHFDGHRRTSEPVSEADPYGESRAQTETCFPRGAMLCQNAMTPLKGLK